MDHFLEDNNVKVTKDSEIDGQIIKAGSKITIISQQGVYSGTKMRIPPPEYEALFIFLALKSAEKAEETKKKIEISKSSFDGLSEVDLDDNNQKSFFSCANMLWLQLRFL